MICFFIEVWIQILILNIVENCNFDNIETFSHRFTKSSGMCQRTFLLALFVFLIFWRMSSKDLFDKLNFQNGTVTIVNVGKSIRGSLWELFIDSVVVGVISSSHIQEPFQILSVNLILFDT